MLDPRSGVVSGAFARWRQPIAIWTPSVKRRVALLVGAVMVYRIGGHLF
jgi:hypothetical protein